MFMKIVALAAAFAVAIAPAPLSAHEGRDHGAQRPVVAAVAQRLEASSPDYMLVAILRGQESAPELEIWLDRAQTNEPVVDAAVEVETPQGAKKTKPIGNGVYKLDAPWLNQDETVELTFTISDRHGVDILTGAFFSKARSLSMNSPLSTAKETTFFSNPPFSLALILLFAVLGGLALGGASHYISRTHPFAVSLMMAAALLSVFAVVQFIAHDGTASVQASIGTETVSSRLSVDRAQLLPDGGVFMPKATQNLLKIRTAPIAAGNYKKTIELPGRIIADPNFSGLAQAATAGRLSPPPNGFPALGAVVKAGDSLAYITTPFLAIDRSTLRQQSGDLDQQIDIATRRLARYEMLAKTGAVAQSALEDARDELRGLQKRRTELDTARKEQEAIRAPVDGIIAAAHVVAGQVADPGAILFQIVDPNRLYVEALATERVSAGHASARTTKGEPLQLNFVGSGLADRNHSTLVHFSIQNPDNLRIGQFVTVYVESPEAVSGVVLPRAAITRGANGETVIFQRISPERFLSWPVRIVPLDADRVVALDGAQSEAPVVSDGAEFLNQIR